MISTVSNSSDDATGRGTAGSSRRNLVAAVFLCMTALFAPVPTHAHDTELYRFPPLSANMTETSVPLGITVGRWR